MELNSQQRQEIATEQSNAIVRTLTDQIANLSLEKAHVVGALRAAEMQVNLLTQENSELRAKLEPEESAPKTSAKK